MTGTVGLETGPPLVLGEPGTPTGGGGGGGSGGDGGGAEAQAAAGAPCPDPYSIFTTLKKTETRN